MKTLRTAAAGLTMLAACLLLAGDAPAVPGVTVVMSGLDNPRGLAIGDDGAVYVAEAGRGGSGQPGEPVCAPTGRPAPEDVACAGRTGAISRLRRGVQRRIVTGLPSHAAPTLAGDGASGPQDVARRGRGNLYVSLGLGGGPEMRATLGQDFGWLIRVQEERGTWRKVADVAGHEFDANPDGGVPDSNPYGLLAPRGGVLTDAGGNSLVRVAADGSVSTIAVFESRAQGRSTDSVPTCATVGPDGAYYVGELTGVPFLTGAARVYRVVPGQAPEVFLQGFTTIIDLAFGPDGSLYVLQHSSAGPFFAGPGSLVRVAPDGTRTTVLSGLDRPTAVALATARHGHNGHRDGEGADDADPGREHGRRKLVFYISNRGNRAGIGEVLRFEP